MTNLCVRKLHGDSPYLVHIREETHAVLPKPETRNPKLEIRNPKLKI